MMSAGRLLGLRWFGTRSGQDEDISGWHISVVSVSVSDNVYVSGNLCVFELDNLVGYVVQMPDGVSCSRGLRVGRGQKSVI